MQKTFFLLPVFISISFCTLAQPKTLSLEQQVLSVFQGRWTIAGSETTYLEICERIQGNHIQCISTSNEDGKIDSSVSYLTYSIAEKTYLYYGIYGSGSSRILRGTWNNNQFIFQGERVTAEKTIKWKVTIIPTKENLHFTEEVSVNGGLWEKRADFVYKRIQ